MLARLRNLLTTFSAGAPREVVSRGQVACVVPSALVQRDVQV